MGKFDYCMKEYLQNKEYFADLFNGCCFDGQTVIRAEDLTEASETYTVARTEAEEDNAEHVQIQILDGAQGKTIEVESASPFRRAGRNKKTQLLRDVKMKLRTGATLQVLAVENQSYIDYSMPVRCMDYDVAEYNRQLREKKQQFQALRKQMKEAGKYAVTIITYAEKLSGIFKTDRLQPVYTICLYTRTEPWDGPRQLSDMMEFGENELLQKCFADYSLRLFCVNEQSDFEEFHTELRELFRAMSYRKDKEKFLSLAKDERYAHLSEETWDAIRIMTGREYLKNSHKATYKIMNESGEERYDMCQALQELREDFINEGKREGKREGRQEGRRAQQCYTIEMMLNKNYDLAEICSIAGCDPAFVEKVREKKGGKGGN